MASVGGSPGAAGSSGGKAALRLGEFLRARGGGSEEGRAELAAAYAQAATAHRAAGAAQVTRAHPAWRWLGPSVVLNGQSAGGSRMPVSGRVSAVAVDPANERHILVGAAAGGIWESVDGGASWAARSDGAPTLAIGALAFDPTSPNVVYAGTGEGDFYLGLGQGVCISRDGGTTWSKPTGNSTGIPTENRFRGQGFFRIIVDPADRLHLLAATTAGLWVSFDGAQNWTLSRPASPRLAPAPWPNAAISLQPGGGAGAEVLAADGLGLSSSTDGGRSFTPVALPGAPAAFARMAVCHAPSDPRVAYAFGHSDQTYLWRRDASLHWSPIQPLPDRRTVLIPDQCWYDWLVAVSPDTDTQVYLGSVYLLRGDLAGGVWTWQNVSARQRPDDGLPAGQHYSIHADFHALAFSPNDAATLLVGCDGGYFKSTNRGDTWTSLNDGLGITQIESLADNETTTPLLLCGTQDNGTLRYTGHPAWEHVADGDGGDCSVDGADPRVCFHSFFFMGLERSTAGGAWGTFQPSLDGTHLTPKEGYQTLFYPPMGQSGNTVAQAGESVFISRDGGDSWPGTGLAIPSRVADETASALDIPGPDDIWLGTTAGRVLHYHWGGSTWSVTALPDPGGGGYLSDLLVDRAAQRRLWATFTWTHSSEPLVKRSDNGGRTWAHLTATGLPGGLPVNAVAADPSDPRRAWVGTDAGVYRTVDAGDSWAPFSSGLPNLIVGDLALQSRSRLLRAATRDRGVWEIPV